MREEYIDERVFFARSQSTLRSLRRTTRINIVLLLLGSIFFSFTLGTSGKFIFLCRRRHARTMIDTYWVLRARIEKRESMERIRYQTIIMRELGSALLLILRRACIIRRRRDNKTFRAHLDCPVLCLQSEIAGEQHTHTGYGGLLLIVAKRKTVRRQLHGKSIIQNCFK